MEDRKLPSWLKMNDDFTYTATVRGVEYTFKELKGRELNSIGKLTENSNKPEEAILAAKSLISPEIPESEFFDLEGSVYLKLCATIKYVYELDNFLE